MEILTFRKGTLPNNSFLGIEKCFFDQSYIEILPQNLHKHKPISISFEKQENINRPTTNRPKNQKIWMKN